MVLFPRGRLAAAFSVSALILLFAARPGRAGDEVVSSMRNIDAVAESGGFSLNQVHLPNAQIPEGDFAPPQTFEIARPEGRPLVVGQLYTSGREIRLEAPKRVYSQGEQALLTLRNIAPTQTNGQIYTIYVQIIRPIRATLRYDAFVQSRISAPAELAGTVVPDGEQPADTAPIEVVNLTDPAWKGEADQPIQVEAVKAEMDALFAENSAAPRTEEKQPEAGGAVAVEELGLEVVQADLPAARPAAAAPPAARETVAAEEAAAREAAALIVAAVKEAAAIRETAAREAAELEGAAADEAAAIKMTAAREAAALRDAAADEATAIREAAAGEAAALKEAAETEAAALEKLTLAAATREAGAKEAAALRDASLPFVSLITLGVSDMERSGAFYEALGWRRVSRNPADPAVFFQLNGQALVLYPLSDLLKEQNMAAAKPAPGNVTLALHVAGKDEVEVIYRRFLAAGAAALRPPSATPSGAVSCYVADPDGNPWEISWVPRFRIDAGGGLWLP
jgi:catechol 2,3-dioxygenase-like lactoylglutathione lyase family enzyme